MKCEESSVSRILQTFTRRDLFRTAGLPAGGAMLVGRPKSLFCLAVEPNAAERMPFSAVSLFLELDGQS